MVVLDHAAPGPDRDRDGRLGGTPRPIAAIPRGTGRRVLGRLCCTMPSLRSRRWSPDQSGGAGRLRAAGCSAALLRSTQPGRSRPVARRHRRPRSACTDLREIAVPRDKSLPTVSASSPTARPSGRPWSRHRSAACRSRSPGRPSHAGRHVPASDRSTSRRSRWCAVAVLTALAAHPWGAGQPKCRHTPCRGCRLLCRRAPSSGRVPFHAPPQANVDLRRKDADDGARSTGVGELWTACAPHPERDAKLDRAVAFRVPG